MRRLMEDLEREVPQLKDSMLAALGNIVPSHLMDRRLHDFLSLCRQTGDVSDELDNAVGSSPMVIEPSNR